MDQIGYILFGWLLGIISPLIVGIFEKRMHKRRFLYSSANELKNISVILSVNAFLLLHNQGKFNIDNVSVICNTIDKYDEHNTLETSREFLNKLSKMDQKSIDELNYQLSTETQTGLSLKRISAKFLDSNLNMLPHLSLDLQSYILNFMRQNEIINNEIDKDSDLMKQTFSSDITEKNYFITTDEIFRKYLIIARSSVYTISIIDDVIKEIDSQLGIHH